MVFYAHLLQEALNQPTIVVMTDRIDLDDQLYTQFARCSDFLRQSPVQAGSKEHLRAALVEELLRKVQVLERGNFAVRQHLRYVEKFSDPKSWEAITYEDTLIMADELAPLIAPDEDDPKALRFDALMYGIELAYLVGKTYGRGKSALLKKVNAIAGVSNIPAIQAQSELIRTILETDYLQNAGINEFENIRQSLRYLIKYIPYKGAAYFTDFDEEILSAEWKESELENDNLKNYRAKAEFYVKQHQDTLAIAKLRSNQPLTETDIQALEQVLWSEVGTKEDYEAEFGAKPLGKFVREIVGMDMRAARRPSPSI